MIVFKREQSSLHANASSLRLKVKPIVLHFLDRSWLHKVDVETFTAQNQLSLGFLLFNDFLPHLDKVLNKIGARLDSLEVILQAFPIRLQKGQSAHLIFCVCIHLRAFSILRHDLIDF